MSKIYDALKHSESPVVGMIEDEQSRQLAVPEIPDSMEAMMALGEEVCERGEIEPEFNQVLETEEKIGYSPAPVLIGEGGYRIARIRVSASQPVLPFDGSDRRTAECYRSLRTNILHHSAQPKTMAVSSAGPGDGKTTSAINLAGVLALKRDIRVVLVDADLRQGSISTKLGIESSPGLAEVLAGESSLEEAIVQTEILPNLHVLPAGRSSVNPAELLDSEAWRDLISELRGKFQFTIVDTTPIGVVTDYALVEEVCDGTMVVVRPDHTDRRTCVKAIHSVAKGKLLGTVLNCAQDWFLSRTHDYYGYYGSGVGEK